MTLKEAAQILKNSGIAEPLSEARKIFSLIGNVKDCELLSPFASCDSEEVKDALLRRSEREPLQYILSEVCFYRERYKVTKDVLIPREDSEILVDYAVKNLPCGSSFIDLCTGSGCIALSVLNNTVDTKALAVDISKAALSVAKENAERLSLGNRISFLLRDALKAAVTSNTFAVLSNPPYVSASAYENLEKELYFEPKIAFVGGEDGGDFYRAITPLYRNIIDDKGFIAFEIGYDQGKLLTQTAKDNRMSAEIIKDLSGNDRVAVLRKITD